MNCKKCGAKLRKGTKFCVECGSTVVRQSKSKRIIAILLALLVLLGIGAGLVFSGSAIPVFVAGNNEGFSEEVFEEIANSNYIEIASDDSTNSTGSGEILIRGSMEEAVWEIEYENGLREQDVEDAIAAQNALEEDIELDIEFDNDSAIISIHKDNIEPGMPYTITIGEGIYFTEEKLVNARAITFIPKREDIEKIEYKENVYQLEADEVIIQNNNTIQLTSDRDAQVGDIVVIPVENEYSIIQEQAFRVDEVLPDGSMKTVEPMLEEVFEELEISGTYSMNPDDFVLDEEAIEKQVRESSWFDGLIRTAYAEAPAIGESSIKIKKLPSKNKMLNIEIKVTAKDALKNRDRFYDVEFIFTFGFKTDVNVNIVGFLVFDISSDSLTSVDVAIGVADDKGGKYSDFTDLLYDDEKYLRELEDQIKNEGKNILKLGSIPIPIGGPVCINIDFEAFLTHSFIGEIDLSSGVEYYNKSGAIISLTQFKTYKESRMDADIDRAVLIAKLDQKAGIKATATISVLKAAQVGIEIEGGQYSEMGLAINFLPEKDMDLTDHFYGYMEAGLYYEISFVANLHYLFGKVEYEEVLEEGKLPLIELGERKSITGITSETIEITVDSDGKSMLSDIKLIYYDIFKDEYIEEPADYSKLVVTCPDGMSCSVDPVGNIVFEGDIPDEFQVAIGYQDTKEEINLDCLCNASVFEDSIGNTSGNIANGGIAAQSDGWIYYRSNDNGSIYKMKNDGSEETKLNSHDCWYINVVGDWVYYVNTADGHERRYGDIFKMCTDGSSRTLVASGDYSLLTVQDGYLYCIVRTDSSENEWYDGGDTIRMDLEGGDRQVISKLSYACVSGNSIIYKTTVDHHDEPDWQGATIEEFLVLSNLDGIGEKEIATAGWSNGCFGWESVHITDGKVYYGELFGLIGDGNIYVYDIVTGETSCLEKLSSKMHSAINYHDGKVYYSQTDNYREPQYINAIFSVEETELMPNVIVHDDDDSIVFENICIAGEWMFYEINQIMGGGDIIDRPDSVEKVRLDADTGGPSTVKDDEELESLEAETLIVTIQKRVGDGFDTQLYGMYEVESGYMLTCGIQDIYMLTYDEYRQLAEGNVTETAVGRVKESSDTQGSCPEDVFSFVDIEYEDEGYFIRDIPDPGQEVPIYSVWLIDPISYETGETKEFFVAEDTVVRIIDYDPWFKEISFKEFITTANFDYDFRYYANIKDNSIIELEEMYEP